MSRLPSWFNRSIRRGYALLFAFVFIFYIGLSALPAVLMEHGKALPAERLYRCFRLFCHQLPQRSWFLYGAQPYYPLQAPEGSPMLTFGEAAGFVPAIAEGKAFFGTPEMGYKMAVCQRDIAIYGAMALFCIIFALSRCSIPAPHWLLPLLIGVVPIAADGITQLLGNSFPGIFPFRESGPLLRTVTGALFGFCLCWYLFPRLESSLKEGDAAPDR